MHQDSEPHVFDESYMETVKRYARAACRSRHGIHASEELYTAGWLGFKDAARTFDPSKGASFRTWANRKIEARTLDEARVITLSRRRKREFTEIDLESRRVKHGAQAGIVTDIERRELIDSALEGYPDECRDMFRMRYGEGRSHREIARMKGIHESMACRIVRDMLRGIKGKYGIAPEL